MKPKLTQFAGFGANSERRQAMLSNQQHWRRLNTSQRFAFYTLAKLGYQLMFVRHHENKPLAITCQDSRLATIDAWGEVDFAPNVQLRP